MFAAIYTWKLKDDANVEAWEKNWHEGTVKIYERFGSLGASLHKTPEGYYLSYARWRNKEDWEIMMQDKSPEKQKYNNDQYVVSVKDPILLELIDDQLKV